MPGCTAATKTGDPCTNKHYSLGLCRKHYMAKRKQEATEEKPETEGPKYISPSEVLIGQDGTPPEGSVDKGAVAPKVGPDGKPLPAYSFSFGTLQVELAWEQLSMLAPSATPLRLTPVQREQLDAAFMAAGITTTNPWVVICMICIPPSVLFLLCHYEEISLNMKRVFKDMAQLASKMKMPPKQKEPERLV
jgi:hypothetical protein